MIIREMKNLALVTAIGVAMAGVAHAQSDEYERKVALFKEIVLKELPEPLADPQAVVDNLLGATLGTQLSKSFDPGRVWSSLVGRQQPSLDPQCKRPGTPVGEAAQDECVASLGSEGGGGEYRQLSFSRNIGLGNIKFLSRPKAQVENEESDPARLAVKLTDQEAFDRALGIAKTLGLADEELALPPAGVPLPVKSLAINTAGGGPNDNLPAATTEPVVIQKVVFLPRGLTLPKPLQIRGFELPKVRAPGNAWIALGDPTTANPTGIKGLGVSNWMDLRRNDKAGPAKTRDELADEIARELVSLNENATRPPVFSILIGLSVEPKGTHGLLLPAVEIHTAPVPKDPDERTQESFRLQSTAGTVFEVALVKGQEQLER